MRKIGFIVNGFPLPSETFIAAQVAGLAARGYQVTVIADRFYAGGGSVERLPRWRGGEWAVRLQRVLKGRPQGGLTAFFDLLSDQRLNRFDLLIAHFGDNGRRLARSAQLGILRRPFVTFFHGYDVGRPLHAGRMGRYAALYRKAARLLTVSEHFGRLLIESGAPAENVRLHRMGVDCRALAYRPPLRNGEMFRIMTVARLVEKKGLPVALEALAELRRQRPEVRWRYDILGDGPLGPALRAQAEKSGLADRVHFHGVTSHAATLEKLREADLFLLPSVTAADGDVEGIPVALMEAMATGLPVLSSLHSGIPELIESGKSGFLVPERDAAALAERIAWIADHPAQMGDIAAEARRRIEQEFDNDRWNDRLAEMIEALLLEGRQR